IGIYGFISFLVTGSTREIGIRMALGAARSDIFRLVLGQAAALAVVGVAAGLIAATLLTRLLASMLFGVSPTDLATLATISLLLILMVLAACYVPARRATRVDPLAALRHE
ncbi:MAG TPA: FtsX-like permease family protein, partial [Blastocatellia bacterium]|nr:FtsX-like permease family protein [Blastocatellia bacterium]